MRIRLTVLPQHPHLNKQTNKPSFEDMAKELLNSMDTNKSGSIDSAEFSAAAQALSASTSSSDSSASNSSTTTSSSSVTDAFNAMDTNSDGSVSTDELMTALKNTKPQGGMPPPPPDSTSSTDSSNSTSASSSKTYDTMDTNEDGTVSIDELLTALGNSKTDSSTKNGTSSTTDSSTASSTTQSSTSSQKLSDLMLKNILSYYGNNTSSTDTTSLLSISA